ncbi:MAG: response regulator [Anaerolineaceae bacterium]|nr:response regulator [Anaerolineaceae bacterium]
MTNNELILVVDDNDDFRDSIEAALRLNGFLTCTATDGFDALRQIESAKPDLMLLDLQMPRMDGLELLDRMNEARIELPVILMTAHGSEAIAVEVFRKGVKNYVIKGRDTLDPDEILAVVHHSLVEIRLRREKEMLAERLLISNFKLQQRVNEFKVLHSIGKSVAALMDIDTLLMRVVGAATMLTQSMEGSIHLVEQKKLMCRVIRRGGDDRPQLVSELSSDALAKQVVKSGKPVLTGDEESGKSGVRAVATPLSVGGKVLGVLVVRNNGVNARPFTARDGTLMSALSDYTAIALENAHNARRHTSETRKESSMAEILQQNIVFISYSRSDWMDFAGPLVDFLTREGFNVWVDQNLLLGGEDWLDTINEALARSAYMILCVSPRAMTSTYVKFEYRYFFHQQKPLIPLICEPTPLPAELLNYHNLPYNALQRLSKLLKDMMSKGE